MPRLSTTISCVGYSWYDDLF